MQGTNKYTISRRAHFPWYYTRMANIPRFIGRLKLFVQKDGEGALQFFADDIVRKLNKFRDEKRDVLFLSAGGSALGVLDRIDESALGPYLTIGIFDERWDPSNKTSNYAQIRKTKFYPRAVSRGCRLIDTATGKGQTQVQLADFYEKELRSWRERHPSGIIMATVGIALDGHVAGIMPFSGERDRFHALFEGDRWIVAYDATGKNPYPFRVTTTFGFLRTVDLVGVYLVGKEKGPMFRRLIQDGPLHEIPGRIVKELPRGAIYTDSAMMKHAGFTLSGT